MENRKIVFKKLFILSLCVFGMSGCGEDQDIKSISFDENYQSTWKVGTIDFSSLKFFVTHSNGTVDTVPCNLSMIEESDVFKFYKVGDWKVKINYNDKYYNIVDFTILENEFDSSLTLKDEVVSYDGKSHGLSIDGPVPEGTNIYFPQGNNFTNVSVNPYNIRCILSKDGYKTKELTGKLTITKSNYSKELLDKIEFKDAEFVYDGTEKKIEAKNIPHDCKIEYFIGENHGNSMINAGVYKITGVITCSNPNYNEIPNIEATLTIKKATHDLKGVSLDNATYTYEPGVKRTLLLTNEKNVPNNIKIIYENNIQEDAGEYDVTARFEVDANHEEIAPMSAKLRILPKDIDLSEIDIKKIQTATYDGTAKYFEIDTPSYLKITKKYINEDNLEVSDPIDAGNYQVKITFEVTDSLKKENYKLVNIPEGDGVLVIQPKVLDLSVLNFDRDSCEYDGEFHEFNVEREVESEDQKAIYKVPNELVINKKYYLNGVEMSELPKEIGEYVVTFEPTFKSELDGKVIKPSNYIIISNQHTFGNFSIVKHGIDLSNVALNDQGVYYDGGNKLHYNLGELPKGVVANLKYYQNEEEVKEVSKVGIYFVSITFSLDEANGYTSDHYELLNVPKNTPSLYVLKVPFNLIDVVPQNVTLQYTGFNMPYDTKNITNYDTVSQYVHPLFEYYDTTGKQLKGDDLPKEKGTYTVIVSWALNPEYPSESYTIINGGTKSVQMTIE